MNPFPTTTESLSAQPPDWLPEALFWITLVLVLVGIVGTVGVWMLVRVVRDLRGSSARLEALDELKILVRKLVEDRDDLDLRRLEHVLVDLRDTQKRLEDSLVRAIESARKADREGSQEVLHPHSVAESLGERVLNRLLAMGYTRVHVVTRPEKVLELVNKDGEILVEARRDGVLHKGRVLVRGGRLADVEINPAYSIFP